MSFLSLCCFSILSLVIVNCNQVHDNVGLLIGSNKVVFLYNITNPREMLQVNQQAFALGYHWNKGLFFVMDANGITRSKQATSNKKPATVIKSVPHCKGFAVDWEEDRIYFAEYTANDNTIKSIDLNGGNETILKVRRGDNIRIKDLAVDPYERKIFWIANGAIESYSLSDHVYRTDIGTYDAMALTLDLPSKRIYFAAWKETWYSSIYSVEYKGSSLTEHFTIPGENGLFAIYGMGFFKGNLYCLHTTNDNKTVVTRTPMNDSNYLSNTFEQVIKNDKGNVWDLKLVHADLQKPPAEAVQVSTPDDLQSID